MRTRVIRTIHPVGQGAFYSERFYDIPSGRPVFTVVYDCGVSQTVSRTKSLDEEINMFVSDTNVIDILFISHYHADHFNGIMSLITKEVKIKNIILPYIEQGLRDDLNKVQQRISRIQQGTDIILFSNPYTYLKDADVDIPRFIYIKSGNGENNFFGYHEKVEGLTEDSFRESVINIDNFIGNVAENDEICLPSGYLIGQKFWFYRPFVKDINIIAVKSAIEELNRLINEYEATENKDWLSKNDQNLKKQYKIIQNSINNTSLMVFSSPIDLRENNRGHISHYHPFYDFRTNPYMRFIYNWYPSCLYTGDIHLSNDVCDLINDHLGKYRIGLLQLPHHGADNGWDVNDTPGNIYNLCRRTNYFFSYGINNTYQHPGKNNIKYFLDNNYYICGVNELPHTEFIQVILTNII